MTPRCPRCRGGTPGSSCGCVMRMSSSQSRSTDSMSSRLNALKAFRTISTCSGGIRAKLLAGDRHGHGLADRPRRPADVVLVRHPIAQRDPYGGPPAPGRAAEPARAVLLDTADRLGGHRLGVAGANRDKHLVDHDLV